MDSAGADDLLAAVGYVLERNPVAARELRDRIVGSAERLLPYPQAGRPGRVEGTRELVVTGAHFVLPYRVVG